MTPEEKFNQDVWWVFQEIRKAELFTPKGEKVEFIIENLPEKNKKKDTGYIHPNEDLQRKLLYKLKEWEAIDLVFVNNILRGSDEFNKRIFQLSVKQPKFNELYKDYESLCRNKEVKDKSDKKKAKETEIKIENEEPKTITDYLQEIVSELYKQYKKYPAGKKIRYEVGLGIPIDTDEDDQYENNNDGYFSRLEALDQLKEEQIVLDYVIETKDELSGLNCEYKIAKCLIDKKELQEHINDLAKAGKINSANSDEDFKQYLYQLRMSYTKIIEICDVFAGNYIAVRNGALNQYYTALTCIVDDILEQNGFEELKSERPELFESLIGDIENFDIEWEYFSKQAYNFLAKIEKIYLLSGAPTYKLPPEIETFLQKINETISEHRKYCNEEWQKMLKRIDAHKNQLNENEKTKTTETTKEDNDKSRQKILDAIDETIVRGFNGMFTNQQNTSAQQAIQKVEIVKGNITVEGLKKDVKNKFPYKLPAGTKWEDFTIKFEDEENIFISVKRIKCHANFEEMGMVGKGKKPNPSEGWFFLRVLAGQNGELTINDAQARDRYKKQKELLTKSLQHYFSLDYDPFYPYHHSSEKNGNSYKVKMTLIPLSNTESKSSKKDKDIEDEDDLGTRDYLKEIAPII